MTRASGLLPLTYCPILFLEKPFEVGIFNTHFRDEETVMGR